MLHHQLSWEFNNIPVHLSKKEAKHADKLIQQFFGAYHLHEIRHSLAQLIEIALTTSNTNFDEAKERDSILWFYYELEIFIEAAWFQNCHPPHPKQNPKRKTRKGSRNKVQPLRNKPHDEKTKFQKTKTNEKHQK